MAVAQKKKRYRLKKATPRKSRTRPVRRAEKRGSSDALPGWKDLAGANRRATGASKDRSFLENISTTHFAVLVVGLAVLFTLYVGHVHATQDLLADVQEVRKENLRLHLKYNRLKGEFDRMVGPSVIYGRASELGMIEDPSFGPTIEAGW